MTVTDQDGNVLFTDKKDYGVYDLHLPSNRDGWLGFDDWDITAMTHIDLGIEPHQSDSNTYVVPLKEDTKSVTVQADFVFNYEPGQSGVINSASKQIVF